MWLSEGNRKVVTLCEVRPLGLKRCQRYGYAMQHIKYNHGEDQCGIWTYHSETESGIWEYHGEKHLEMKNKRS